MKKIAVVLGMMFLLANSAYGSKFLFVETDGHSNIKQFEIDSNNLLTLRGVFHGGTGRDFTVNPVDMELYVNYDGYGMYVVDLRTMTLKDSIDNSVEMFGLKWNEGRMNPYLYGFGGNSPILARFYSYLDQPVTFPLAFSTRAYDGVVDYSNNLLYVNQWTDIVTIYDLSSDTDVTYISAILVTTPEIEAKKIEVDGVFSLSTIDVFSVNGTMYSIGIVGSFGGAYSFLIKTNLQTGYSISIETALGGGMAIDRETGSVYATGWIWEGNQWVEAIKVYDPNLQLQTYHITGEMLGTIEIINTNPPHIIYGLYDWMIDHWVLLPDSACVRPFNPNRQNYLRYQLCVDVQNAGDQNVVVTDYLAPEVEFVSAPQGTYNEENHTVNWSVGSINPWDPCCLELVVAVKKTALPEQEITNVAEFQGYFYQSSSTTKTLVCSLPDFNTDRRINFFDFAEFAQRWLNADSPDFSLDNDSDVDIVDIVIFTEYWLQNKTDYNKDMSVDFYDFSFLADAWLSQNKPIDISGDSYVDIEDIADFCNEWLYPE